MIESAAGEGLNRWKIHRPLGEPVLESVEEEMGLTPTASEPPSAQAGSHGIDRPGVTWGQLREQMVQQVKEKPARSAMLALSAGAMAAWLVRGALVRRRQGH